MCTQFNATTPEAIQAKCFPLAANTTVPVTNTTTTSSGAPYSNTTLPVTTNSTVPANSTDPITTSSSVPLTTGSSTPVSVNATTTSSSVPLTTGSSNSTLGNSTYLPPPPPFANSTYVPPPPPFLNSTTNSTLGNSTLPPFANFTLPVTNATNATVPDYTCMNTTTLRTLIPACALDCQAKALAATTCAFEDLECNCLQTGAIEAVLSTCLVTSANCTADEIDGTSLITPK
jgi:hypothetical protein